MHGTISRRRLLLGTAIGGSGAVALAVGRPAKAFTTESIEPSSALGLAYADRCVSDSSEHAQIRASLEDRLAGEAAGGAQVMLVGDLNVATLPGDVTPAYQIGRAHV